MTITAAHQELANRSLVLMSALSVFLPVWKIPLESKHGTTRNEALWQEMGASAVRRC